MADNLEKIPTSDIRAELHARAKATDKKTVASVKAAPASPLASHPTGELVKALINQEKVIYGEDNRKDFFEFKSDAKVRELSNSVAALFSDTAVVDNGDGTSTLRTRSLGEAQGLCPEERFFKQPIGAFCSGFLVGADLVATAGHCANAGNVTTILFVFGFRMEDADTPVTRIPNKDIYRGKVVLGREEQGSGPDWGLIQLDRPVTDRDILKVRRTGRIGDIAAVSVMGHPSGLPIKYADDANVRDNTPTAFFVANLDTYGGNSGSPVFGADHVVEGILVRGETDYVSNGACNVSKVCPTTGCRGEDCTRIAELIDLLPPV
ncbi:serine protease (plasmid) [Bradyrhizobium septentrionale]|uniref:Trypsin-like peptidase domain-containing protein n=1 Tax=Bradyrhizobium septentrionale TaxID=1404411 RepID=A0A973WAI6_9BRAD|nr:serine protease [Bradyrhizobium septentrionale]UGY11956.1 serine protease [Bradyrhizobium septentrionale]UGY30157.1 serine protease [Bradyrhizobium septentrionale]